jgi:hypothetical protein
VQRVGAEIKRAPLCAFTANKFIISAAVRLAIGVAVIAGFKSQHKSGAASASAADGPSVPYHLVRERRAANQASGSGTDRLSVATVVAVSGLGGQLTSLEGPTDPPAAESEPERSYRRQRQSNTDSSAPPVPVDVDAEAACARLRINRANFAGRPSHELLDRAERLCVPAFDERPLIVDPES